MGAGWSYLAVLLDAFSRRVVGWAVGMQLTAALPLAALAQAVRTRRPPAGLPHHSDCGVSYACEAYQRALRASGVERSTSRRGNCWDNAVVESFFASLNVERPQARRFSPVADVQDEVEGCIERLHNRERRHSTLGYLGPVIYELRHAACSVSTDSGQAHDAHDGSQPRRSASTMVLMLGNRAVP